MQASGFNKSTQLPYSLPHTPNNQHRIQIKPVYLTVLDSGWKTANVKSRLKKCRNSATRPATKRPEKEIRVKTHQRETILTSKI